MRLSHFICLHNWLATDNNINNNIIEKYNQINSEKINNNNLSTIK